MRIALVRLSALGDVVHALPVAATLRAALPAARLVWIVERGAAPLVAAHPALDEVLVLDTRRGGPARGPRRLATTAAAIVALRRRIGRGAFDVAVDLQGLFKSALVTLATGAPVRVGLSAGRRREPLSAIFATRRIEPPPTARHVVEQHLALLATLGVTDWRLEFALPRDRAAEARIDGVLAAAGVKPTDAVVVLSPGAGRPAKRWPPGRFRGLARRLGEETAARVVVVWGPGEATLAGEVAAGLPVLLAPPTTLPELIALLRRATVVVAGDTGPLHLAAAAGRPCVGLYGPTSPERNGPYGPGHRTLRGPDGTLVGLDADAVVAAVAERLE
jgi:heptosyltransferase I